MTASSYTVGFVYVMTNELMPGIVKIGETSWLPEDRATGLYTTGVPQPFDVVYRGATSWPKAVELTAHESLKAHRIKEKGQKRPRREFFRVSVDEAIETLRSAAVESSGIDSWKGSERHHLRSGDRVALTLEAGQVFVLVAYRSVMAERAEPIDFWQAHSDGDLLEILVTDSSGHIAGFSDGDTGSTEDPVPYLDRASTVANGMINGRERLVPGDRLIWLPAQQDAGLQASVVFEARDYCQVVGRTWSPRFTMEGWPLVLNAPTFKDLWPAAIQSIREVLTLALPRSWAPREDRDSSFGQAIGSSLPPPEHWLPQLKRRSRKRR